MVSAKRKQQLKQQLKPWNDHVAKVKAANPNLEYKEVLKKAKRSYKKGKSGSTKSGTLEFKTSKYSVHVRPKSSSSKKKPKKKSKKRSSRRNIGWLW
tara:strand:- start:45 stop:335 length:291 start_codon:yes stop_codon:yes gene_type:complete